MAYPVQPAIPANQAAPIDGQKATYSASVKGIVPASSATDIFIINGSGSTTVRVTRVEITGSATTEAAFDVSLIVRSAANTGTQAANPTAVPHDSNDAAATATVGTYTTNPTVGTAVGPIRTQKMLLNIPSSTGVGPSDRLMFDFGTRPGERAVVLRGTAQGLAVNLNSGSPAGGLIDISVTWTEE